MDPKKLQEERAKRYGIAIKSGGNVTKPGKYANVSDDDFADPVNYRYPIDAEHIHAALSYWGMPKNREEYSSAEAAKISDRMHSAAQRLGVHVAEANFERLALNFDLACSGDGPPTEIMLIPPGNPVTGRDGRSWNNPDPSGVVDFFESRGVDMPVDIEHSSELKAPQGEEAPAMAWITSEEARSDGSVWGKVDWTKRGSEMVMNREYRYYSPVLVYEKATLNIRGISSVGLTNKPNLFVNALNREQQKEDHPMLKRLLALLGLPETTTEEVALNHVTTLKSDLATALNQAQSPDLTLFIPRQQFDAAVTKANNAERALKEMKSAELEKAINSEIDGALKAGKIVPATREFYSSMCRQEGGLDKFREFLKAAPVIGADTDLDSQNTDATGAGKALNSAQKEVCQRMGITEEEYLKAI
jgi:phage I-like protein